MVKTRRMCIAISSQSRSSGISEAVLFVYKSADALKCISTPIVVTVL